MGYVLHKLGPEYREASMPAPVQKVVAAVLGSLAVLLGKSRNLAPWEARDGSPVVEDDPASAHDMA